MTQSLTTRLFRLYYALWPPARRDTHDNRVRFYENRRVICRAPYPLKYFSNLLRRIQKRSWMRFAPFTEMTPCPSHESRVFVRHDIDTAACVENLPVLLEVDNAFGVPAAIFMRPDGENYPLADCRDLAQRYRDEGFEVGLHTACYMADDYMEALRQDVERFTDVLGFAPRSMTTHGTGERQDVRARFNEEIKDRLGEFCLEACDCHPSLRPYEYATGDSAREEKGGPRVLHNDFLDLPAPYLAKGRCYMIMTHPFLWR